MHVEDHCEALDRILHLNIEGLAGEVINLGSGRSVDIMTIAEIICDKMSVPRSKIVSIGDRPGQVFRHTSSTEKAWRLLQWKANTDLETGLDRTIQWYRENRSWWEKQLWLRHIPIITASGKMELH
jgi:dTDP-glucose 4,6-dehydratase